MSRFVAKNLQPRQKAWNSATQSRIAAISSMLSTMKVVKMLGYQSSLMSRIQELREEELWAASRLRWVMVYYNMSGMPYTLDGDYGNPNSNIVQLTLSGYIPRLSRWSFQLSYRWLVAASWIQKPPSPP
jgi:hypothetical protein